MDSTTQYMLALLRASLNETTPNLPTIDTGEWERIYWLARKHGVVTMVNDAIEKLPSEQQPQGDIALSWTLSAERTRYHYAHQTEVLQAIDQKAQAENLPYILLKGMTLAKLYPRPDSRPCGDIDICFPHNFERGNALLGDSNPHLHFHIVPKYEGGFEFGGSFAITNPDPVFLKDEEYQEMIAALQKELGI